MDRCSQHSFKSQPSEENEVFLAEQNVPSVDDNIVQEEDLQSEADCPNGECPVTVVKRNSTHSITRVSVNLSRQSSQQQQEQQQPVGVSIMMVNDEDEGVQQDEIEPPPAYQQQHPAINYDANGRDEEEDVDETFENSYQHAVATQPEEVQSRPVYNVSMENDNNNGPQESANIPKSAMPRPNVRQPSQQSNEGAEEQAKLVDNAEEKVLSQIRAKRNVANLIAKFSTAATTEEKEKENGGNGGPKQKMDNGGGGAINIQAIRQKFNQQ